MILGAGTIVRRSGGGGEEKLVDAHRACARARTAARGAAAGGRASAAAMTVLVRVRIPRIVARAWRVGVVVVMRMRVEDLDCGGGVYGDVRRVVDRMAVGEIRRVRRVGGLYAPLVSCGAAN